MSDPYALCSCGSGKKFRFCCQGIASTLEKAFSQARAGQLDSALRTMDQAVSAEPKNLELRLHKAKLLDALKRRPEAETVLDEAISIDGAFAAAHFQRALWRRQEGEIQGAAILARKAVDLYPLDAKEQIAQVFAFLSQVETQLGRPIAARNALRMATRFDPNNSRYLDGFEALYGEKSGSPSFIRREYSLLSPPPGSKRRAAWDKLAKEHRSGRLSDLAKMFNTLAEQDPQDPAAAFNAALTSAWLGDNTNALKHLDRFSGLETDSTRKETALILSEALRAGHGSEPGDHALHEFYFVARNPALLDKVFAKLNEEKRLLVHQADENEQGQTMIEAYLLAKAGSPIIIPGEEQNQDRFARVVAHMTLNMPLGRVTGADKEIVENIRNEFAAALGWNEKDSPVRVTGSLGEAAHEPLIVPMDQTVTEEEMKARQAEEVAKHFGETWINKPLKSHDGKTPTEAAKTADGKIRVAALVRFLEEVSFIPKRVGYSFDILRKALDLPVSPAPAPVAATATAPAQA